MTVILELGAFLLRTADFSVPASLITAI